MAKDTKVSVVTAVFNAKKYLEETVKSVLNQTFKDFEYILIDDCSKDGSFKLMEKLAKRDKRIKILRNKKNIGQAATRNRAIDLSLGEYVCNLDNDDIMTPKKLEKQYKAMKERPEIEVTYGGYKFLYDKTGKLSEYVPPRKYGEKEMAEMNLINNNTVMMRRNHYDRHKRYAEDYSLWMLLMNCGKKFMPIYGDLLHYRIRENAQGQTKAGRKKQDKERDEIKKYWSRHPLISIIMPTYNRGDKISRAIASIQRQEFTNWELIIVNDGGKSIEDIVKSFNDPRLVYVEKENGGLSSALNYGLKQVKGLYISYLDDDDYWHKSHLVNLFKYLYLNPEVDLAYTQCNRVTGDGDFITLNCRPFWEKAFMNKRNFMTVNSIMHKKEIVDNVGYFDEALPTLMDWDYWRRVYNAGFKIRPISDKTAYYVQHRQNMVAENRDNTMRDTYRVINKKLCQ